MRFPQEKHVCVFLLYTRHWKATRNLVPTCKELTMSLFTKTMTTIIDWKDPDLQTDEPRL